jgi:hypothetical protein
MFIHILSLKYGTTLVNLRILRLLEQVGRGYPTILTSTTPTVSLQKLVFHYSSTPVLYYSSTPVLQYFSHKLREERKLSINGAVRLAKSFIQYLQKNSTITIL